jgi:hypothetical protein
LHLFSEFMAEDGVAVAERVVRELVEGKCPPQLLFCPPIIAYSFPNLRD